MCLEPLGDHRVENDDPPEDQDAEQDSDAPEAPLELTGVSREELVNEHVQKPSRGEDLDDHDDRLTGSGADDPSHGGQVPPGQKAFARDNRENHQPEQNDPTVATRAVCTHCNTSFLSKGF